MLNGLDILAQAGSLVFSERRLELERVPSGWSAVLMAAVVLAAGVVVVHLYRGESRAGWSVRARTLLAALRCSVLLALAVVWLDPVLATYLHHRIEAYTLVLADTSASMSLSDSYPNAEDARRVEAFLGRSLGTGPVIRMELLRDVLGEAEGDLLLGRLRARNGVRLFGFAGGAREAGAWRSFRTEHLGGEEDSAGASNEEPGDSAGDLDGNPVATMRADGAATDLGRSLEEAIESVGGAPIAGIVLVSDGSINRGLRPDRIGDLARSRNIPVFAVGIGDPAPPINVRITGVDAPQVAFSSDPFALSVHLRADGLAGRVLTVSLYEEDGSAGGIGIRVQRQSVTVPSDGWDGRLAFEHTVRQAGRFQFRVVADVGQRELTLEDNERRIEVTIQENRLRALLISGGPSWEYRALARLLERDESVELSCWLQSAAVDAVRDGNKVINQLPGSPAALAEYDAVVMLDPRPDGFPGEWAELVSKWVVEGSGGFLYGAGRKFGSRFMRDEGMSKLVELLPVVVGEESDLVLTELGHYQRSGWPIRIADDALDHPLLRQADDPGTNRAVWERLGAVYWHFPVRNEKPVATVLMRHGNPQMRNAYGTHILLAVQYVGGGRSAFLAIDSTWRWRRFGEAYFNRFWINALRYLAEGKSLGGRNRVTLRADRQTYRVGEAVRVSGRFLNANYAAMDVPSIRATVTAKGEEPIVAEFRPMMERPGWYEATVIPRRTGLYRLEVRLTDEVGGATAEGNLTFQVSTPNLEMANPTLDRPGLRAIAEASGGAYFDVDEWSKIPGLLEDRHEEVVVAGKPEALWDRWYTLVFIGGLLALEWALRKKARLL